MKKHSDELQELGKQLGFSIPGPTKEPEESEIKVKKTTRGFEEPILEEGGYIKYDDNEYIQSFHNQGNYQWPVQVGLKEEGIKPNKMQLKHFKQNAWEPITKDKEPYFMGHFAPGVNLNPSHRHGHNGVDLSAPIGTPVYPIGPGKVTKVSAQPTPIGGITAYISHENGNVVSYYAHLHTLNVNEGQEVDFNTVIGTVGMTGNAIGTSPHLHYEVKVNGKYFNPKSVVGKPVGSLSQKNASRKNQAFEKIIDIYLDTSVIKGKDIVSILSNKTASEIGDVVKILKKELNNNPNMIIKEAKKIITSS